MQITHFDTIEQSDMNKPGVRVYPNYSTRDTINTPQENQMQQVDHSCSFLPEPEMTRDHWKAVVFLMDPSKDSWSTETLDEVERMGYQAGYLDMCAKSIAYDLIGQHEIRYNVGVHAYNTAQACAIISPGATGTMIFRSRAHLFCHLVNLYYSRNS